MTQPFDETSQAVTFEQIAGNAPQTDGVAARLWDKAWQILTADPKSLRKIGFGGSMYLASPQVSDSSNKLRYSVAALSDKGKLTKTLFVVVNDKFDSPVLINKDGGHPPLMTFASNLEVEVGDIDIHLDNMLQQAQQSAKLRKGRLKKTVTGAASWIGDTLYDSAPGIAGIAAVLIIGGLIASGIYASFGDDRYAGDFDAAHNGYILTGEQLLLGEERMLKSAVQDTSVNLPKSPDSKVHDQARWLGIKGGTCKTDDTVKKIGYLDGSRKLVVTTNAPSDIVRVRVARDGLVDICALNPGGRDSEHAMTYMVSLQAVPLNKA